MTKSLEEIKTETLNKYISKPWYLKPWFIGLMATGWMFIIPGFAALILAIIDIEDSRRKRQRLAEMEVDKLLSMSSIASEANEIEKRFISSAETLEMQEFGFYDQEFDIAASGEYKAKIIDLQNQEKIMVKNKTASTFSTNFRYNNSLPLGRKMVMREVKIALWAFNTHCDNVMANVSYRNRSASERKIRRAYEIINENEQLQHITSEYLALKLSELESTYLYRQAIENEKELLREQREKEREDKKLQAEILFAKSKIEKDEKHINTELQRLDSLLASEKSDKKLLNLEIEKLRQKLAKLSEQKKSIQDRETNAYAGYVYVISNIGSFGENIVKIGVTRRLEPMERINELGDASVPFKFDVHALVFSDKAFALETKLHQQFTKQRVNMINARKEFYNIPLAELEQVITQTFGTVNFTKEAEAREYRESQKARTASAANT